MARNRDRSQRGNNSAVETAIEPVDYSSLPSIPMRPQAIEEFFKATKNPDVFGLRRETMRRIEKITGVPICCYVSQTDFLPAEAPAGLFTVDGSDLEGFDDLIGTIIEATGSESIDVLVVSNGGSAEAAERIVRLLRGNFTTVRFILAANAFSAATMMAFACDSLLMNDTATLGPIDPQINGIPARTILRGFEGLERRLKEEGPDALAAYIDLLKDYSLHLLEFCKSAEALSKELARNWLSEYMLKCEADAPEVSTIVDFFADFDIHKSHGRSIGRNQASELGVKVEFLERGTELDSLVRSLNNQYTMFLRNTPFLKVYENAYGTTYGRQFIHIVQAANMPLPK